MRIQMREEVNEESHSNNRAVLAKPAKKIGGGGGGAVSIHVHAEKKEILFSKKKLYMSPKRPECKK